jgi:hypothetical protein
MPYSDFANTISSAMRAVINSGLIKDRTKVIPVLIILSLHTYCSDDRHLPAELAALAVSHAHTMGLHHPRNPGTGNGNSAYLERLFCCVWAMDRLTAAFHGRPIIMHDRDCGRDLQACFSRQEPCFRLFLENVSLLDSVINLYRPALPSSVQGESQEIPRFEELVEKAEACNLEPHLLRTLGRPILQPVNCV